MAYRTSGDLLSDVRRISREKENKITSDEVFYSQAFFRYAMSFVTSMTERYTGKINLKITKDLRDCPTAYTNGDRMVVNPKSDIVTYYKSLLNQFKSLMGLVFHETAHVLYLDFSSDRTAITTMETGYLYGDIPTPRTDDEAINLLEMQDCLKNSPACKQILGQIYHTLSNIISDVHDETAMKLHHSSFVGTCLNTSAESLRSQAVPLEDMEADPDGNDLSILFSLMLQTIRYGEVVVREDEVLTTSPYMETIDSLKDDLLSAGKEDDFSKRMGHINAIMLALWPYIRDMAQQPPENGNQPGDGDGDSNGENQGNGDGSGNSDGNSQGNDSSSSNSSTSPSNQSNSGSDGKSNGNGNGANNPMPDLTDEQLQKIMEAIQKAMENAGGNTNTPTGRSGPPVARAEVKQANKEDDQKQGTSAENLDTSTDESMPENALESVISQAAKDMAENEVDEKYTKELQNQLQTVDMSSAHKGVPLTVLRPEASKTEYAEAYSQLLGEVKMYSKRMQKGVLQVLKDMRDGYTLHHRQYGPILEASEAYRVDNRYFANKKLPQDVPDMAVAVLIDESGSMWSDNKIQTAQRAAVLLHDFCLGIDIPVHIAGHHTNAQKVVYTTYTDFTAVGDLDRYRLMGMRCGGCNRDGMAAQIAAGHLQTRPEQIKLLIVISDGLPNHTNYGGSAAEKDIQEIVRKAKRQGIEVIGAAIDSDKDTIKRIYGDGFLDITNLETLPKTLVNIVKKRVVPY